jgi:hypothetical protein
MKANIISLVMLIGGPLLTIGLISLRRPSRKKIRASLIAGLLVSLVNFLIEALAVPYDVYYVRGLWPIFNSPLSRTIGWVFLGMAFALASDLTRAMPHPRRALILYFITGILFGLITDYLGTRWLEFMALGKNGNWLIIFLIWSTLVPGTILVYRTLSRD